MRVDKNTREIYADFGDWLRNDGHTIWISTLVFALVYYLGSTEEV